MQVESCYTNGDSAIKTLIPSTLEGCVVRLCDMIAYLGKDRQDARTAQIIDYNYKFQNDKIGTENAVIINNLTVDIIENSYKKDYILLSKEAYADLKRAKKENYEVIYRNEAIDKQYNEIIRPMFIEMYEYLLDDLKKQKSDSVIFKHHIDFISDNSKSYDKKTDYFFEEENQIVVDYIASMTDDYFIALHKMLFPDSKHHIEYKTYFD